jgi:predicted DNA-binding protein (MmcQ/YjbR family)
MDKPLGARHPHTQVLRALRAYGLAYPGARTKSPWPGHLDLVVGDKTFAFLSSDGEPLSISCKLSDSRRDALSLPFAEPTRYGLGKSGWVSASFSPLEKPPLELLQRWVDESYRARAPKKLIAQLDGATPAPAPAGTPRATRVRKAAQPARKPARRGGRAARG